MNKTKIEWCDFTINPIKGLCPMACSYCYARAMYKRFGWDTEIRFDNRVFSPLEHLKPSRVFVGSTMELFGDWIDSNYMKYIFRQAMNLPQHTFIFLTKQPHNLIKWDFPDNCWVGVSVTNMEQWIDAIYGLQETRATVKFISFEPLLERIIFIGEDEKLILKDISWVIIGAMTGSKSDITKAYETYPQLTPMQIKVSLWGLMPKIEWIQEIIEACDKAGIPVFEKNNLQSLFNKPLRQEYPL